MDKKRIKIKMSEQISYDLKHGNKIRTVDVIKHILDTMPNVTTNKPVFETSLSDLNFNGWKAFHGIFDTWTGELFLWLRRN